MIISILVFWLFTHFATDPQERYEMTETYVKTGSGKSSAYFDYKGARIVHVTRNYIELKGRVQKMRVYAPSEADMAFVRSYIMCRLPGAADIRFE